MSRETPEQLLVAAAPLPCGSYYWKYDNDTQAEQILHQAAPFSGLSGFSSHGGQAQVTSCSELMAEDGRAASVHVYCSPEIQTFIFCFGNKTRYIAEL